MKLFTYIGIIFTIALGVSVLAFSDVALAATNPQINYQGKLTDDTGATVANGAYNMEFKLYTAPTGGSAIWTETLTGANQVTVQNGLFSTMLGSTTALTSVDFNQTLYLGVNIDSDGEMTPRKTLGSVPAAFEARRLEGVAASSFLRSDQADTASGLISFTNGIVSSASSTITNLTTTIATTTTLVINSQSFTNLVGTGLTNSGGVLTLDATGNWSGTFDSQEGSYYLANSFSTSSANFWEGTQVSRYADDLTNNSIQDLSDVAAMTETSGDLLSWNGSGWTNVATSSLGISGGSSFSNSSELAALLSDESGTGLVAYTTNPVFTTPNLGTPSAVTLTSGTGLPIVAGTTGTLSVLRGGTGVTTSTGTGNVVLSASPTFTGTVVLPGAYTIGANSFTRSGAHNLTLTTTAATTLTLPTSGTLYGTAASSITSAQLAASLTTKTGTGNAVFSANPTLTGTTTVTDITSSGTIQGSTIFGISLAGFSVVAGAIDGLTDSELVISGNTDVAIRLDKDNNSSNTFNIKNGANSNVFQINESGNVVLGGWQGSTIGAVYGGTGLTSYTTGDLIYSSAANTLAKRAIGTAGQVLQVNGGVPTWVATSSLGLSGGGGTVTSVSGSGGTTGLTLTGGAITTSGTLTLGGTLAVANGGTGVTSSTGSGNVVLSTSPTFTGTPILPTGFTIGANTFTRSGAHALTLTTTGTTNITFPTSGTLYGTAASSITSAQLASSLSNESGTGVVAYTTNPVFTTPNLGTPSAVTLTSGTGLPISTGLTGAGTGVLTALGINVGTAGSFITNGGVLGTPSSGVATNLTGTAAGLTAGTVTTNANLTGAITSTGNATLLGSFTSANLATALTDELGTGNVVYSSTLSGYSTSFSNSAGLAALLSDETGTGNAVFSASPTFSGTLSAAAATLSSTLTLSGSAANIALGSNYLSGDGGDEGIFITSGGNVLIGHSTDLSVANPGSSVGGGLNAALQINATGAAESAMALTRWSATAGASPGFTMAKSMGASIGTLGAVTNGADLGAITFAGDDGTDLSTQAARILAEVDSTVSTSRVPGRLTFSTAAGLSDDDLIERLRIDSSGNVGIGDTSPASLFTVGNGDLFQINSSGVITAGSYQGTAISSTYLDANVILSSEIDTSAEILAIVTDETGSGAIVFATSPTLVTPNLGTPSTLIGTNITGTAAGLTAGNATKLATPRTIAGVSFDGSANISLNNNAITNGAGYTTNTGTVTSVSGSGGTTGLTLTGGAITTSGTLTLGGTLAVANGGTGVTSSTGTGSVVLSANPTFTGTVNFTNITMATAGKLSHNTDITRDKLRVWNSDLYTIGMDNAYTLGALTGYAMTFQMNSTAGRGFWWGTDSHTNAQGAMALSNDGKLTVANSMRLGYGISDTTAPGVTHALDVSGTSLFSGNVGIGPTAATHKLYVEGGHSDSIVRLKAENGVNPDANLFLWASEPALTYTGAGIGNNWRYTGSWGREETSAGASYVRLLENAMQLHTVTSAGVDTTALSLGSGGAATFSSTVAATSYTGSWLGTAISSTYLDASVILASEIDTSAELAAVLSDETGSGLAVFNSGPLFNGTIRQVNGGTYDVWIQGSENGSGDTRNLALLGVISTDDLILNYNTEYDCVSVGGTSCVNALDVTGSMAATGKVSAAGASGFSATTYATNARNPIYRFDNADGFGLSYFQGTAGYSGSDSLGIHIGTATAAGSVLNVRGSGVVVKGTLDLTDSIGVINTGGNYVQIPNGLYVSGGIPYFQNQIQARGGINNDTGTILTISGGTTATTYFTGDAGIGVNDPDTRLEVFETVAASQFKISYDATRYAQFQVNSVGDLTIDAQGGDVTLPDENLFVCAGGACASTPNGTGNITVEGSVTTEEKTLATSGSITVNWDQGNQQYIGTTGNVTIAFSDNTDGQTLRLVICFGGAHTVTWPVGIEWSGNTEPTETSVSGRCDIYSFLDSVGGIMGASTLNHY